MKKHIACLLLLNLFLLCYAGSVFSMKTEEQPKYIPTYVPRGLLIFLDDYEEKFGAISGSLKAALEQEAGPIITSASLLIRRITSFYNPDKWVIKEIETGEGRWKKAYLYLLLPTAYLNTLPDNDELKLGLKVNHMKSISFNELENKKIPLDIFGKPSEYADYFFEALESIFCTRSDYIKSNTHEWPEWSIYLTGHGQMNYRTVGLNLSTFQKVLDFFEHKIDTRFVIYQTCYGAGLNTEQIYKDNETAVQKTYPFTIITTALTDAPTKSRPLLIKYSELFKAMTKKGINYKNVIEALKTPDQSWADVPQIRLPGLTWFSVMSGGNEIASIGEILAKTRDKKSTLEVKSYFNDPKIMLLYAKDIPLNLAIYSNNLEAIISMIPGNAIHTIYKISSTTKNYEQIFDLFMAITMLDPLKIFFISEITDADQRQIKNVLIYNKKQYDTYERYAFFEEQDNAGKSSIKIKNFSYQEENLDPLTKKPKIFPYIKNPDKEQDNFYQDLLLKAHGKIQKLGIFSIDNAKPIVFDVLHERCCIEKIELTGKETFITNIAEHISEKLPRRGICWIKEMTGKFNDTEKNHITISDVIVLGQDSTFYFSLDGKMYSGDYYARGLTSAEELETDNDYRDKHLKKDDIGNYFLPPAPAVLEQREGALLQSSITDEGIEKIKIAFEPTGKIQTKMKQKLGEKNDLQEQISKLRTALQQLKKSLVNLTDQMTQVKLTIGKQAPPSKLTPKEKTPTPIPAIIGTKEDLAIYAKAIEAAAQEGKGIEKKRLVAVLNYVLEYQLCPVAKKLGKTSAQIEEDLKNIKFDDNTKLTEPEINRILKEFKEKIQKN